MKSWEFDFQGGIGGLPQRAINDRASRPFGRGRTQVMGSGGLHASRSRMPDPDRGKVEHA